MRANFYTLFLVQLPVALSACQTKPQSEIDETKSLLDSAQIENIQYSYPEEFQILKDSINVVLEEIEGQKSRFALKKYDTYKEQLKYLIEETRLLIQKNKESKNIEELPNFESNVETEV